MAPVPLEEHKTTTETLFSSQAHSPTRPLRHHTSGLEIFSFDFAFSLNQQKFAQTQVALCVSGRLVVCFFSTAAAPPSCRPALFGQLGPVRPRQPMFSGTGSPSSSATHFCRPPAAPFPAKSVQRAANGPASEGRQWRCGSLQPGQRLTPPPPADKVNPGRLSFH